MQPPPVNDISPNPKVVERLSALSDDDLMKRWQEILAIVRQELTYLNHQRRVMQLATDVYNANPRLLKHNGRQFFDYVRQWYGGAMATGYRRQTDPDGDSASLRVLLEELLARPEAYSLETLRPYSGVAEDGTIRFFALRVAGADQTGKLDVEIVKQDIRDLIACGKTVKRFVNKVLAHTDIEFKRAPEAGPSYDEIHSAHKECEQIAKRWIAAFSGPAYSFDVVEQFDWLDIFDFPWRVRKPFEEEGTEKYIVTRRRILSDAELEAFFEGHTAEQRADHLASERETLLAEVASLQPGDSTSSRTIVPDIVRVERLT